MKIDAFSYFFMSVVPRSLRLEKKKLRFEENLVLANQDLNI